MQSDYALEHSLWACAYFLECEKIANSEERIHDVLELGLN